MAALLRKLQGPNSQSRGSLVAPTTTTASFPADTHMFLIEVIAFGEVYAVPVTKATPATVVLRYVMEAAVSPEDAAQMGSTEATLYYKEKPLPLDTVMGKLPRRAVLHLHSSLTTTASVVRDRRQSAVSMLSQNRQRFSQTTVTMQPVLKETREGSGSTAAGLSSEGSPSVERAGSSAEPLYVSPFDAAPTAVPMMFSPVMMPMYAGTPHMMPYCYCLPMGHAGAGGVMRMAGPQGRTVSAPCLSASRRRDSAVEYANSYHFPASENPLGGSAVSTPRCFPASAATAAAASRGGVAEPDATSPRAGAPVEDRLHVVVYLRLPRDRAAARLSAAALSGDCTVEMEAVEADEVPLDELLNTTFSTVATNRSQRSRVYAYRRLRVRKDFPVGTLRELCAVDARHRLHLAHAEITDERQTFAELHVPASAVFYFKAAPAKGGNTAKTRPLTRERLKEHIEAGALRVESDSPSHIDVAPASLDRSLPSPSRSAPQLRATAERNAPLSVSRHDSSSIMSSQSIHERIEAFNDGAVRNPAYQDNEEEEDILCGDMSEGGRRAASPTASSTRYVVEGRELIVTSAVASEQARRAAELAARKAEAQAEAASGAAHFEWEEDVEVDVAADSQPDAPAPTLPTARGTTAKDNEAARQSSPDPIPHALSAAADTTVKPVEALGERRSAFRWLRRTSATSGSAAAAAEKEDDAPPQSSSAASSRTSSVSSSQSQRGPHPERWSRAAKARSRREQKQASAQGEKETKAATTAAAPLAPLVPADVTADTTITTPTAATAKAKQKKLRKTAAMRSDTPAPLAPELHSHFVSTPVSNASSRTSSLGSSIKAKLYKLTRRSSKSDADKTKSSPPATTAATAAAAAAVPTSATAADEALEAMKRKSERVSRMRAAVAAAVDGADATEKKEAEEKPQSPLPAPTTDAVADAPSPAKERARRTSSTPSLPLSYSERRRQSTDAVARQPVSFLGADPAKLPATAAVMLPSTTLEEASATLGPLALSNTRMPTPRIPTPRSSPSPVSILVSPSPEQRKRENSSAEATRMTEMNVRDCQPRGSPEARASTPDYSVESTGSFNRLRITIRDPEDATRFHYGVPVEAECPVGALREWITAMQHPTSVTGKPAPSLRDVDRYGVFVGDTYLADEMRATFGAVTGGRNDVVFSIRRRD